MSSTSPSGTAPTEFARRGEFFVQGCGFAGSTRLAALVRWTVEERCTGRRMERQCQEREDGWCAPVQDEKEESVDEMKPRGCATADGEE
mmetsp:Transcript_28486/g.49907  ORF Transcript_28486/g.49907 Transcript_28486/m.49907 type:complete len:89 (+) Transcript_28486:70-336(+)